jgi:hypothetical protein
LSLPSVAPPWNRVGKRTKHASATVGGMERIVESEAAARPNRWRRLRGGFVTTIRKRKCLPGNTPRETLDSRGYADRTGETHRAALVPGLMQRQSDPQSLFAVHFTSGHPTVEAQPDRRPPGLTQVQPDPQLPDAQSPAPEQVPSARQRLVPPPISRQTQPDPQGLFREHAPAGQVGDGSGGVSSDDDLTHTPL